MKTTKHVGESRISATRLLVFLAEFHPYGPARHVHAMLGTLNLGHGRPARLQVAKFESPERRRNSPLLSMQKTMQPLASPDAHDANKEKTEERTALKKNVFRRCFELKITLNSMQHDCQLHRACRAIMYL